MRIALVLEYDGRPFCGWQAQPSGLSVQDALESALSKMAGHTIRLHAAGRTDAGVHACQQVAHFDTSATRPLTAWVRGVNSFLPAGIAVLAAQQVPDSFHARYCATARHYRYLLLNHPVRPALLAGRVGWHHSPLDLSRMQAAGEYLLGEHDFSTFRAAECQAKTPIKRLLTLTLQQQAQLLVLDVSASGFLHHMVRNIVGALVHIGKGAAQPIWMHELLLAKSRSLAPPTFMPDGLYFVGASYPEAFGIASVGGFRHHLI